MDAWLASTLAIIVLVGALLLAGSLHAPAPQSHGSVPSSPLDYAERILASRYARREISAEEYGRMLVILRR